VLLCCHASAARLRRPMAVEPSSRYALPQSTPAASPGAHRRSERAQVDRSLERDEALDVLPEPEGMLPHQALRAVGVARLKRVDDLLVVDDRPAGAVLLEDGALPDGAHMEEQTV